ncbi:hypothetical protein LTR70_005324 [Exophiala xenobiotica]|uniref:Nickel/cobalt efflux system n=1 Tax=Lithohypha guttulata TaxID=1690604 RepID=A0ABR0K5B9_9EURO|nr:hypothetical protein LTR24_006654 [Lithohypha guttulata]KAK5318759.1 hypothetical protein LTR70_005324 [Exophiala xenobiotica]
MASTTAREPVHMTIEVDDPPRPPSTTRSQQEQINKWKAFKARTLSQVQRTHNQMPYVRALPLPAILIILLLIVVNLAAWAVVGLLLASKYTHLLSTAALAYSLGLRHALDADHISAIDLMTRRLIATGQRPVTVGTFFSLGHSTIVVLTSIVVAATAAGVSSHFDSFSNVGGIIGTSISAAFLIALGVMNAYILYKLVVQLQKVIRLQPEDEVNEAWKVEGGGVLFRVLKKMFKLIDRPWKMYPLGVLFGLGFDTSSEVALLGISSIQGAKGTSMWLILVFPVLFTVGMCLIDTIDGALMSSLYLAPMGLADVKDVKRSEAATREVEGADEENRASEQTAQVTPRVRSPLTFLYYSIVLTALTVVVALIIGVIQLLNLMLHVAVSEETAGKSQFWHGVELAGEYYDVIGGVICGSFVVVGIISVLCYRPWRRWVDRRRAMLRVDDGEHSRGEVVLLDEESQGGNQEAQTPSSHIGGTYSVTAISGGEQVRYSQSAGKGSNFVEGTEQIGSSSHA